MAADTLVTNYPFPTYTAEPLQLPTPAMSTSSSGQPVVATSSGPQHHPADMFQPSPTMAVDVTPFAGGVPDDTADADHAQLAELMRGLNMLAEQMSHRAPTGLTPSIQALRNPVPFLTGHIAALADAPSSQRGRSPSPGRSKLRTTSPPRPSSSERTTTPAAPRAWCRIAGAAVMLLPNVGHILSGQSNPRRRRSRPRRHPALTDPSRTRTRPRRPRRLRFPRGNGGR